MPAIQDDSQDTLIICPAQAADRAAVVAFCRRIWEGNDYVNDEVFDTWLHDVPGPMLVARLAGKPVAMAKVAIHPDGHAWFQGLRVDPGAQGQGIARRMHEAVEEAAAAAGASPWALLTADAGPTAVQHLCDAHGWMIQGRTHYLHLLPESGGDTAPGTSELVTLDVNHWSALEADLVDSLTLAALGGWYTLDWECEPFTTGKLYSHLRAGQVWALPDRRAWGIVTIKPPDVIVHEHRDDAGTTVVAPTFPGGYAWWAFAEGREPDLTILAHSLYQQICRQQHMELSLHVPTGTPWDHTCQRANFWRDPDHPPKQFRLYTKTSL